MGDRRIETWALATLEIVAATESGLHGRPNQDAYVVVPGRVVRVGVFDGVGGHVHGRAAAHAGAKAVQQGDWAAAIERLVGATRGATTAIVAEVQRASLRIHWSGDSAAFLLGPAGKRVGTVHRGADGQLTKALGLGMTMSIEEAPFTDALALCTDGVHDWLDVFPDVQGDLAVWANQVLDQVRRAGSRDDATLVLVRRRPTEGDAGQRALR